MKKQLIFLTTLLISISLVFVGCNLNSRKKIKEKAVVKIGAILPLTGSLSQLGVDEKLGIEMALNEINNPDTIINVIYEDSKGGGKDALFSVNKLINQGITKFILSTTPVVNSVMSHYKGDTTLFFFAECMTPRILQNHNNASRIYMTVDLETDLMRDYINKMNYQKIALFYINNDFGKSATDIIIEKVGEDKIVTSQTFSFADKDYKNQLSKLKKENPDLIIIYSYPTQWISLIKQIEELNTNIDILANSGFSFIYNNEVVSQTKALSKVIFPAPNYIYNDTASAVISFNDKIKDFGGEQVNFDILFFYDLMKITAKNLDPNNQKFLRKIAADSYSGISGEIKFNNENDIVLSDLKLAHVIDNKLMLIK